MAADLFVVPTVTFRLLFVLVILAHDRRQISPAPRRQGYLLHDRDSVFADVATTIVGMNTQTVRTAPRWPWQNAYAERVIGSIRRECLDHMIVANTAVLHRLLTGYITYYMQSHTPST